MRLIRLLKNDMAREAAEWVDEEIISESQAEKICERYGADYHQSKSHVFGYNVLIGLGYLFLGLALIILLGANWDEIPRAVRMWGLIALTMAVQGLALRQYLSDNRSGAASLFFLGNFFYGASIILIAQVYHLGEHMPDGIFWWALGCLPIGLLINNAWVTLQSALLAVIWFLVEVNMGFYPALMPLFIIGSLIVLYRSERSIMLFLTVVVSIGLWVEYTLATLWRDGRHFDFSAEHVVVTVSLFILAYLFSHWLASKQSSVAKDYGSVLAVWSLRFGLIIMAVMSFEDPWQELITAEWRHVSDMLIIVAVCLSLSLWLAYRTKKLVPAGAISAFFIIALIVVLVVEDHGVALYLQVLSNIVLVTVGIWLVVRGIHGGISHYFFLGVASILVTAFMRYIDLIGDYIGGAMLFLVLAAVLLGAAKYWKRHQAREVLS